MTAAARICILVLALELAFACTTKPRRVDTKPAALAQQAPREAFEQKIERHAKEMLEEGKKIFRFDTFGSEDFWGGKLRLHEAVGGRKAGRRRAGPDGPTGSSGWAQGRRGRPPEDPGFYHDGRFEDYKAVVSHYNGVLGLNLSAEETADLVEYLKSL